LYKRKKENFSYFSSSLSNQTENPTPKLTKSNQKVLNTNCTMARDLGFSQNISRQKKKSKPLKRQRSQALSKASKIQRESQETSYETHDSNKNSPRFNLISNTNASPNQRNRSKITSHHRVIARTRVSKVKIIKKNHQKDSIRLTSRSLVVVAAPKAIRD
jgi:hypothetical protein